MDRSSLYDPPPPLTRTSSSRPSSTRSISRNDQSSSSSKNRPRSSSTSRFNDDSNRSNPNLPPPSHQSQQQRQQQHHSLVETVEDTLSAIEHGAQRVESFASQVEKGSRTGRRMVEVYESEYGENSDDEKRTRRDRSEGGGDEQGKPLLDDDRRKEKVVPYQPVNQTKSTISKKESTLTMSRRKNATDEEDDLDSTIDKFRDDLDTVQESVDDLFDLFELIATDRYRLTGSPYNLRHLMTKSQLRSVEDPTLFSSGGGGGGSNRRELKQRKKLGEKVVQAKKQVFETYRQVTALSPRYNHIIETISSSTTTIPQEGIQMKKISTKLSREYNTLNSSFAKILDFVEDRAKEERNDVEEGRADERLLRRFEEDHPEWERDKRLRELKKVKEEVRAKAIESIDSTSYAFTWSIENPFTELDRTVLATIDMKENSKSTTKVSHAEVSDSSSPSSWNVATILSNVFHLPNANHKADKKLSPSNLEKGRSRRDSVIHLNEVGKNHSYHSKSYLSEDVSDDSEEGDVEKQRRGLIPVRKTGIEDELKDIPYQVPNDDTSGYVETPEELMEDQKDRIKTEHFWTPLVVIQWIALSIMIVYWGIARGMGYANPLGNVNFGVIVGQDAWNDTRPGLNSTFSSSTFLPTSSSSSDTTSTGIASEQGSITHEMFTSISTNLSFPSHSTTTMPTSTIAPFDSPVVTELSRYATETQEP